ncbi:MAG: hypothetical protein VKI42_08560, partial [Synechococcaceae cyanobacterium]|nr:hypothetical protein [Synechococcaceae cyanobacterium]
LEGRVLVGHKLARGCLRGQIRGPILRHHFWEASEAWPELVLDLGDGIGTMPRHSPRRCPWPGRGNRSVSR